ncbi:MAG: hypothetical protein ACXWVD_00330 [Telluria sp.]
MQDESIIAAQAIAQWEADLAAARSDYARRRRAYRRKRCWIFAANAACFVMNYLLENRVAAGVSVVGMAFCAFVWRDLPEDMMELLTEPRSPLARWLAGWRAR